MDCRIRSSMLLKQGVGAAAPLSRMRHNRRILDASNPCIGAWGFRDTIGMRMIAVVRLTNQPAASTLKPAGIAYGNVENWMIGAIMDQPCAATSGTGIWTCGFTRPGGYQG